MPEISRFYGIVVVMYFSDHAPPHFHARYGSNGGRFRLDGSKLDGNLPRRAERLVRQWVSIHRDELSACWERASRHEEPGKIEPLS